MANDGERRGVDARLARLLLAVAFGTRVATFGNPIVHADEQFYFAAADAWAHGAAPYVGVWDRKPAGLFLLYLPAAALGFPAGVWAYQLAALLCAAATAWFAVLLARVGGWARSAPLAGVAVLAWMTLLEGQGGQASVFYDLPVAAAAWMLVCGRSGIAAMALVGVALTIKTSVVFEGVFFGCWAAWQFGERGRGVAATLRYAAALVCVALLPTALIAAAYAWAGAFDDWAFANVISIWRRHPVAPAEAFANLVVLAVLVSAPVAVAAASWRAHLGRMSGERPFLFGWLAAALGGVLAFAPWFDHYGLPLLVPACACAAGAVATPAARRGVTAALVVAALGGQALLLSKRRERGTPAEFTALARAVKRAGPGCLYVYSGPTMLYPASERCRATPWLFPSHLSRDREAGAVGIDQAGEVRRIMAARPAAVVMAGPYRGERAEIRAVALAGLGRGYARIATVPLGRARVSVFASIAAE